MTNVLTDLIKKMTSKKCNGLHMIHSSVALKKNYKNYDSFKFIIGYTYRIAKIEIYVRTA